MGDISWPRNARRSSDERHTPSAHRRTSAVVSLASKFSSGFGTRFDAAIRRGCRRRHAPRLVYLRTEDVAGFSGSRLREEGPGGTLQFDNMQNRGVRGTTKWTEYAIRLPLNPNARSLVFGVRMVGQGKTWADDPELLVDGRPAGSPRSAGGYLPAALAVRGLSQALQFSHQRCRRIHRACIRHSEDGHRYSQLPIGIRGLRTLMSGIGVFYPDKTQTQRVGIVAGD